MATHKQTEANRRNAQKSTGPRTPNGKAHAAMNNLKHGIYAESEIIPGEDLSQRQALEEAYMARFDPQTIEQLHLVHTLVRLDWEQTRLAKAEAQLWTYATRIAFEPKPDTVLGQAFIRYDKTFAILGRRRDVLQRRYLIALRELEDLQSAFTDDSEPAPQAEETTPETPQMASNPDSPPPTSAYRPAQAPPPTSAPHPNPAHPPIEECPNCSRLGYPSPGCQYRKRAS